MNGAGTRDHAPVNPVTKAPGSGVFPDRASVRWSLSLLPTLVGLFGVAAIVTGAVVSGVTDGSRGWAATAVAALLVAVAVVTGAAYGLYLALTIVAIGAMVADGGPSTGELVALVLTLLLVHEITRFSFDARRPMRFGAGLIARYLGWTVLVGAVLVGIGAAVEALAERAPTNQLWIPVGVVGAALPLFVVFGSERLAERTNPRSWLQHPAVRTLFGVLATAAVVAVVVIGAQARSSIVPVSVDSSDTTVVARTTTTQAPISAEAEASRTVDPWMVVVSLLVVAVMIYFILRKPEAVFQLEEIEQPAESTAYDVAIAGLADTEAELISLDREALTRLLGELQLDISSELDPGRAIRFGYAKIEQRLAQLGLERAEAETEREFLGRAMAPLGAAGEAMATLTGLFERARFGHDPVDEAMRTRALGAIDDLVTATAPSEDTAHEKTDGGEAE